MEYMVYMLNSQQSVAYIHLFWVLSPDLFKDIFNLVETCLPRVIISRIPSTFALKIRVLILTYLRHMTKPSTHFLFYLYIA